MDELRELFGDGMLTADEFFAKLAEKGYKLADLSKGAYVDKSKFDRLQRDFDKFKADETEKYAGYDDLVRERDQLKAEREEAALASQVAAANVSEPFRKFVLSEVMARVTEKVTFDKALEAYIAENPQYVAREKETPTPVFRFPSQVAGDESGGAKEGANSYMNKKIRAAIKF